MVFKINDPQKNITLPFSRLQKFAMAAESWTPTERFLPGGIDYSLTLADAGAIDIVKRQRDQALAVRKS